MSGRFVAACLPSVKEQFDLTINKHPEIVSASAINAFLLRHCSRFLSSIGVSMDRKTPHRNHLAVRRYQKVFDTIVGTDYLRGTQFYLDNAGYQIQLAQLPTTHLNDYILEFHDFLVRNQGKYNFSFSLDIASGTDNSVFSSPREIFDFNLRSYSMAADLPENIRKNIFCILHFRGPHLYMIWQRLLFGEGLADSFVRFGTGGLAQTRGMAGMPVFSYAIPLARLILYARQRGLTSLPFHVLGESQPEDVLIHALVEKYVRATHGIDLMVTHDSSDIFQQNFKSRVVEIPDLMSRSVRKVAVHTARLGFKDNKPVSRGEAFYSAVNSALTPFGLGPFSSDSHPMYEGGKTSRMGYFFLLTPALWTYDLVNTWMEEKADELFPLIQAQQIDDFKRGFIAALMPFVPPTKAANLPCVADQLIAGLELLREPDLDRLERLVFQHLRADEYTTIRNTPIYF